MSPHAGFDCVFPSQLLGIGFITIAAIMKDSNVQQWCLFGVGFITLMAVPSPPLISIRH